MEREGVMVVPVRAIVFLGPLLFMPGEEVRVLRRTRLVQEMAAEVMVRSGMAMAPLAQ